MNKQDYIAKFRELADALENGDTIMYGDKEANTDGSTPYFSDAISLYSVKPKPRKVWGVFDADGIFCGSWTSEANAKIEAKRWFNATTKPIGVVEDE